MMQANVKRVCTRRLSILLLLLNMFRVSSYHEMVLQRRRTSKPRHLLRLTMPEEYKQRRRLDGGNGDKGSGGGKGGNSNNNNEESKEKGDKANEGDKGNDDDNNKSNGDNNNNRDKENKENDMDVNNTDEIPSEEEEGINNEVPVPMYVDTDPGPHSEFPNVVLSDYYNNEFVGSLGVGVPPQYFIVVFDTGEYTLYS